MAILNITSGITGLVGVKPALIFLDTTNTVAEVTAAGYLNSAQSDGIAISPNAAVFTITSDQGLKLFKANIAANGVITLANI